LASDELLSQESREKELQVRDAELQDELLPITTTSVNEESLATEDGTAESLTAPFAPPDDQVADTPVPYSTEQTHKDAMGPIELVAGMEVSTYKCGSEECCPHIRYWKGEITEDWSMRIFNDGGDQRGLPPESSMSL
jgi:hypothetical protein